MMDDLPVQRFRPRVSAAAQNFLFGSHEARLREVEVWVIKQPGGKQRGAPFRTKRI